MKAAIYCRVSTDDQEKEGTSLKTQMKACIDYCHEKGYEISHRFSEAYSGLTLDRPKLRELQEITRAGYIDVIVIYCLDRLSRDPTHGVILTQEFERLNVALEAVTEDINNSELGKLISYIRGFASKLEAEKIRERTMRGKMAYLKNGKLPQGTGIGIYGYTWDKATGKRQIIAHEAEAVRKMFSMAIDGISVNKIALTLNRADIRTKSGSLWYPLTIRRILRNQTYAGKTYFGKTKRVGKNKIEAQPKESWILLPDITPPIITDDIFNRAQEAIKASKNSRPLKPNAKYLLTGFMRCSKCGSTIGGKTMNGKYRYYRCRGATPTATRGKICDAGYIKANKLEHDVLIEFEAMMRSSLLYSLSMQDKGKANSNISAVLTKDINQLRKKLKTYPTREKQLYDLLAHTRVTKDYVLDTIKQLRDEQANDERNLQFLLSERGGVRGCITNLKISYTPIDKIECPSEHKTTEELRKEFEAFRLEVIADPKSFKFSIKMGADIISTTDFDKRNAKTSKRLDNFLSNNPDVTINDLDSYIKENPTEYSGRVLSGKNRSNLRSDLVTIEQTSA